jgi:hypothetical protein
MTVAPLAISTLAIVLIVVNALIVLFLVLGFVAIRARDRRQADSWEDHVRSADAALAQAATADRGWHRQAMESAARLAIEEHRPGWRYDDLHLVLVDDRPGIEEDRAKFVAIGDGGDEVTVVLSRHGDRWSAERVD